VKIVEVEWLDSMGSNSWESRAQAEREATEYALRHRSVGYLLKDEEHSILIARSRGETSETVDGTLQIPKVSVLKQRVLK